MANPVTIYIHHQSYRFLAEEEETYLQQCADIVNKEMDQAMAGNTLSITDGAVLAAMNVADKYCKERQVSDKPPPRMLPQSTFSNIVAQSQTAGLGKFHGFCVFFFGHSGIQPLCTLYSLFLFVLVFFRCCHI